MDNFHDFRKKLDKHLVRQIVNDIDRKARTHVTLSEIDLRSLRDPLVRDVQSGLQRLGWKVLTDGYRRLKLVR